MFCFFFFFFNTMNRSESEILVPTAPKRLFSEEPINYRNLIKIQSSDSQNDSNNDWIRPNSNRTGIPPRPSSRNIINIDHGSAMVAVLPESSTPSSGDDQKLYSHPNVNQIQVLPYQEKPNRPATVIGIRPHSNGSSSEDYISRASPPKNNISPTILTDTVTTGSEFRYI